MKFNAAIIDLTGGQIKITFIEGALFSSLPSIDFFIVLMTRPDWKRCQPGKPFVLGQVEGQSDPSGSLLPPRRGLSSSTEVLPHADGHVCLQRYL